MGGAETWAHYLTQKESRMGVTPRLSSGAHHDGLSVYRERPMGLLPAVCVRPGDGSRGVADREPDHVGGGARADRGGVGAHFNPGNAGELRGKRGDRHDSRGGVDEWGGEMVDQSTVFPAR